MTSRRALPVVAALAVWVVLVATGVGVVQGAALVGVVAVQGATGAVWWTVVRREDVPVVELMGMGLALGTLTALLADQLLRATALGPVAWLLPTVAAVPVLVSRLGSSGERVETGRVETAEWAALAVGAGLGLLTLLPYWLGTPLRWDGWRLVNQDTVYHEALARSVAWLGPGDNVLSAGEPLRYHWFVHAWAGSVTDTVGAAPFVTLTRVVPLVALLSTTCLAAAWARRLSSVPWVPAVAVALVVGGGFVGAGAGRGTLLPPLSPSQAMSTAWLLAAVLVVADHVDGRLGRRALPVLAVLALGCVGGKVTHAAVLAGGLGVLVLATWRIDPRRRRRALEVSGVALLAFAAAFLVVVAGTSGNLAVGFDAPTSTELGLDPVAGPLGKALGAVALVVAVLARWVGLAWLLADRRRRTDTAVLLAAGAAIVGLVGTLVLTHPGNSQLFFALSASAIVAVVAAEGLGAAVASARIGDARVLVVGVVGLGVVAALVGALLHLAGDGGPVGWLAPFAVWLVLGVAVVAWRRHRPAAAVLVALGLAVAAVAAVGMGVAEEVARVDGPARPNAPNAWTQDHVEAARWLAEAADEEDVMATNRLCTDPTLRPPDCSSRWFVTAALTGLRSYIEGYDYAVALGPLPDWARQRVVRSMRIADQPDAPTAEALWEDGVRWVWVDPSVTDRRDWEPYASVAYENDVAILLRLEQP